MVAYPIIIHIIFMGFFLFFFLIVWDKIEWNHREFRLMRTSLIPKIGMQLLG